LRAFENLFKTAAPVNSALRLSSKDYTAEPLAQAAILHTGLKYKSHQTIPYLFVEIKTFSQY
jgi:hypothetical protein